MLEYYVTSVTTSYVFTNVSGKTVLSVDNIADYGNVAATNSGIRGCDCC